LVLTFGFQLIQTIVGEDSKPILSTENLTDECAKHKSFPYPWIENHGWSTMNAGIKSNLLGTSTVTNEEKQLDDAKQLSPLQEDACKAEADNRVHGM